MIDKMWASSYCTSKSLVAYLLTFIVVYNLANIIWISTYQMNDSLSSTIFRETNADPLSFWEEAIQKADELLSDDSNTQDIASCLVPNTERTIALLERNNNNNNNNKMTVSNAPLVSLPVLNMGMPKCGSSSLFEFFECVGMQSTHHLVHQTEFEGVCMRDAARAGLPPIETCASGKDALLQIDAEIPFGYVFGKTRSNLKRDDCFLPQLSLLQEIHNEVPNATFVLNFRPVKDWIRSIKGWVDLLNRFQKCHLPNLPRGNPKDINNDTEVTESLTRLFCSHVIHLRSFVELHPSHALIELDLYDTKTSGLVMDSIFPSGNNNTCWGHANKSKGTKKNATK